MEGTPELIPIKLSELEELYEMASKIWLAHYPSIIGMAQTEYMLDKMYCKVGLKESMKKGQHYFWINEKNENKGFIAVAHLENFLFIHKFYILTYYQNSGLGKRVFKKIIDSFAPNSIRLTVNRQNFTAINFYFKVGMKIAEVADFDIGNGYWMNDFIMEWKRN